MCNLSTSPKSFTNSPTPAALQDGMMRTPLLGFRNWNQLSFDAHPTTTPPQETNPKPNPTPPKPSPNRWQGDINQDMMVAVMDAM